MWINCSVITQPKCCHATDVVSRVLLTVPPAMCCVSELAITVRTASYCRNKCTYVCLQLFQPIWLWIHLLSLWIHLLSSRQGLRQSLQKVHVSIYMSDRHDIYFLQPVLLQKCLKWLIGDIVESFHFGQVPSSMAVRPRI